MNSVHYIFTHCQSFPKLYHHQVLSVSKSAVLNDLTSSILECRLIAAKIWPVWLCVFPSGDVQLNVSLLRFENLVLLTLRFFDVAKFTTLTPVSLLTSCKISLLIFGLKYFPYLFWHWGPLTVFSYGYLGIYQIHVLVLCRTFPINYQLYILLGHEH
jgi:hypothetical protein